MAKILYPAGGGRTKGKGGGGKKSSGGPSKSNNFSNAPKKGFKPDF